MIDLVCSLYNEEQLQDIEKRTEIIRDNQKYTGLKNYPEIRKTLKDVSEGLIELSKNKDYSLANTLSLLHCSQSTLTIAIEKLRVDYKKEGEEIKRRIDEINSLTA